MSKLDLSRGGKALLPIVLPENADPLLQNAALELSHFLKRVTGCDFETVTGAVSAPAITLAVDASLAEEEVVVRASSAGLALSGGSFRGVFYAVYTFLEDVLGVHFYTQDVTEIPSIPELSVDELNLRDKPALEFRELDSPTVAGGEWRARNRVNGPGAQFPATRDPIRDFGGLKSYAIFVHTFNTLVPPEKYWAEHPEYYSMVDGVRISERSQLCLTNPEVLAIATESVKTILRQHPEASLISVSQNDWYNPCTCPACAAVDEAEGSHAGTLLRFVNAIAEAIEPEFPHIVVDTLAYQYTRKPPKITKPRANVCVRLCSIECCFAHPLDECDQATGRFAKMKETSAASFQDDLIGWGKICDRVYIWDYVTNFRHYWMPFPNFQVLGPNMKFFVNNGVKGVYEEGNYQSVSPDMFELRSWLMAKLMWNPEFDVEKGLADFTSAVYGPAGEEVNAYIHLLQKRIAEAEGQHFGIYAAPDVYYLDKDTVSQAAALIAKAQNKCLNLSQRIYVEKVALSLEFVQVAQDILAGKIDTARIDAMMDKGRTLGMTFISEGCPWHRAQWGMLQGKLYR